MLQYWMYQLISNAIESLQTTLPTTLIPDIPCDTVVVAVGLKVIVPMMTASATPTFPTRKVLFLVTVGFSVKVPAVMLMLMGIVSEMESVAAKAPVMVLNGLMTEPFPVVSLPLTATQ